MRRQRLVFLQKAASVRLAEDELARGPPAVGGKDKLLVLVDGPEHHYDYIYRVKRAVINNDLKMKM